jgi:coiled-coil and C2 domain-containing protein 1
MQYIQWYHAIIHNHAGVENFKHYEAYEEALRGGLTLTLRYLKFLFFGPPRSGKTSTRRRLIKEIVNLSQLGVPSISTGMAETNDVIIKKLTSEPAAITGSQWWSLKKSKEGDMHSEVELGYIAQLFYRLIRKTTTTPAAGCDESVPVQDNNKDSTVGTLDVATHTIAPVSINDDKAENMEQNENEQDAGVEIIACSLSDAEEAEIKAAFDKLTSILQSDSPEDLKRLLEDLTMINMADVGGQPAFLDMLPALTMGPALYCLFFRLDQELNKLYPVRFHAADSKHEVTLESSYCIEEVLFQCLASIACFSCQQRTEVATKPQASSGALLFGTYKDHVDDSQISKIQSKMEERFKETKLHREGLLLKSLHGKMVITVDNMFGTDESEMSDIRKDIEEIVKNYFPATPIPASWLMFRIVLQLLNKPVISLVQCEEIAKRLSMTSPVQEALWFFHHDIGSLMHYSNIPSMEDIVVCNPQIVFDSISKLIIDKFKHGNRALKPGEVDEFQQKGIFALSHIQKTTDHTQDSLLKLNQLVDILKHHNILAEVKQDEEEISSIQSDREPKFIMPVVLKHASEEELKAEISPAFERASPLFIHFDIGFVPFGVFSASIAHFISRQSFTSLQWRLCDNHVRRNKLRFIVDGAYYVILISRPQYLEVHIERHPHAICKHPLPFICSAVRQRVAETLEFVISKMKYRPFKMPFLPTHQPFNLAFTCLVDSHTDHLMIIEKSEKGYCGKCMKHHLSLNLMEEHRLWFKEVLL